MSLTLINCINPRVDIAFKKIFGVEENKDILMSLLNSIVSQEDQIDQIELLNPYNERNFKQDKLSVLDIKARNKHNQTYFLIEMQLAEELDYHKRGLYSWARVYSNQIFAGEQYSKLRRTIAIHILNFTFIDHKKPKGWVETIPNKYHHRFVLSDKETRLEIFKDIEIHTIELGKFEAINDNDLSIVMPKVKDMLDSWVAVLTKYDLLNIEDLPEKINLPEIKKALKIMHEMSLNKEEREVYNSHLDFLRIEEGAFGARFEAGKEEGKAEGEKNKAIIIAKNLLTAKIDIKLISKATGLTEEEIKIYNDQS
jgi:predicted transposase/invertase (TIGR01784 family)